MHEVIVVVRNQSNFLKYGNNLQRQANQPIHWSADDTFFELGDHRYYCVRGLSDLKNLVNHQAADVVFFGSDASWESVPGIDYLRGLAERRQGMETYQKLSTNMQAERNADALLSRNQVPGRLTNTDLINLARQTLKKISLAYNHGKEKNCVEATLQHCSEEARRTLIQMEELPKGVVK